MKGVIIAVAMLLTTIAANSQQPSLRQYSIPDGLTSNTLYQVYQDSRGYIWAACSNGICKFNGKRFFLINSSLLRNEEFTEISEGRNGNIWMVTITGKTFVYDIKTKTARLFVGDEGIRKNVNISRGHYKYSFNPISDSVIDISLKDRGIYHISKNSTKLISGTAVRLLADFRGKRAFVASNGNVANSLLEVRTKSGEVISIPVQQQLPTHMYAASLNNDEYVVSVDNVVFVIDKHRKVHQYKYKDPIISLFFDRDGRLFLSVNAEGVRVYADSDLNKKPIYTFLQGESISSVLQDNEYAYWFSSLNSGLFYLPSLAFTRFAVNEGLLSDKISKVLCHDGKLWVGYSDNFVTEVDLEKHKVVRSFMPDNQMLIRHKGFLSDTNDNSVWVASNQLYKIKDNRLYGVEEDMLRRFGRGIKSLWPREIRMSRDGGCWVVGVHGLTKIKDGEIVYDSDCSGEFSRPTSSVTEDLNGNLWLASESVWLYKKGRYIDLANLHPMFACRPTRVMFNKYDGRIWISSRRNGVIMYDGKKAYSIRVSGGLQSDNITAMDVVDNEVWLASSTGVDRITITQRKPFRYKVTNFNSSHGIIPANINGVCASRNGVYFATSSGVMRFIPSEYHENKTPPNVIIAMFDANGQFYAVDRGEIKLKAKENYVRVFFDVCTYKNSRHPMYRYRLDGSNEEWIQTAENKIIFYPLSSGHYKLNISAANNDGVWSEPATLEFSLSAPLYTRPWFYALLLLVVAGVVYLVMRTHIRYIQKVNALKNKVELWKSQGLSLQMNPHFLFNTLNSIQLFILKYDVDTSIQYLSKFASLMRKTLENSNKAGITIREELESLELYLELESLRCDHKFNYKIICDNAINKGQVYIPTLLLQPFVENAIWHGIAPKKGRGNISILLQDAGSYIKCRIIDDGVGRAHAMEIQRRTSYKSYATKITAARIETLRSLYSKNFELEYKDLYDAKGKPSGTEVLLVLPKDLKQLTSLL